MTRLIQGIVRLYACVRAWWAYKFLRRHWADLGRARRRRIERLYGKRRASGRRGRRPGFRPPRGLRRGRE